ncbi:MAG: hypothetical protein AAF492_11825, partial [Verrucomicrobiota bacterium]
MLKKLILCCLLAGWLQDASIHAQNRTGESGRAGPVVFPERVEEGVVWIAYRATPRQLGRGNHSNAGWDFYDGTQKQFWMGSGWKSGGL